eukprot:TRINITY_DN50279_c0_g1_i1.p1 TRINITY_DN50279_c0_g1~~TRINITY_DN50279_c0_g1_i1.p1  ORF type:complete len:694 (+),score=167.89 TRINITY_DN50279_c0_g1_i1:42-2084(+)
MDFPVVKDAHVKAGGGKASGSNYVPKTAAGENPGWIERLPEACEPLASYLFAGVHIKLELMCGVTVALAQVPEAVAFALVAGLSPAVGVTSAWIIGLVTAVVGGRPGMICGATGALAVVVGDLVSRRGIEYLFYAVILMGIMQIALGVMQVGKLVKMIPAPVMMGFCNGLALVIGLAQFNTYKAPTGSHLGEAAAAGRRLSGAFGPFTDGQPWIEGEELIYAIGITTLSFLISVFLPYLTTRVPSALMAIVVTSALEWGIIRPVLGSGTRTVADASEGGIGGGFPTLCWLDDRYTMPPLNLDTLREVTPLAFVLCSIGLLESLMTLNLIDDITRTKGSTMRECIGQGVANIVCGAAGGMGGCAMIGQSMINIGSGARERLSSIVAAVFLLLIVLCLYPAINAIPVSALAGVMFNVVYHTFEWGTLGQIAVSAVPSKIRNRCLPEHIAGQKIRRTDALVIVLVTVVTLLTDLAFAVACGCVLSCLMFAWDCSELVSVSAREVFDGGEMVKVYEVEGMLFFGSTTKFLTLFDVDNDPDVVHLVFSSGFVVDYSALEALHALGERYGHLDKKVIIQRLKPSCHHFVRQSSVHGANKFVTEYEVESSEVLAKDEHHHLNVESFAPLVRQNSDSTSSEHSLQEGVEGGLRKRKMQQGEVIGSCHESDNSSASFSEDVRSPMRSSV